MNRTAFEYEDSKVLARHHDVAVRIELAGRADAPSEILYFLAEDSSPKVRGAVAANPATPIKADTLLSRDSDIGVRCQLARKVVGAGLSGDERSRLWRVGFTILETLARDQMIRVRQALAQGLRDAFDAPREIIIDLAHDPEPEVAVPILESSPVLTDTDLIEILEGGTPEWAQSAMARRVSVSSELADALATRESVPVIKDLLGNRGADIGEATLERVIVRAPQIKEWHEPLVMRPNLPPNVIVRLAKFVSRSALQLLKKRDDVDADISSQIATVIAAEAGGPTRAAWRKSAEPPMKRAQKLMRKGQLTETVVGTAIAAGDKEFVTAALCLMAGLRQDTVARVLNSQSAKAVTALAWKSGISMRLAMQLQIRIAAISPISRLNARDGVDYPLSPDAMIRSLEFFTD